MNNNPTKIFVVAHLFLDLFIIAWSIHDLLWVDYPQQVTLHRYQPLCWMLFAIFFVVFFIVGQSTPEDY